MSLRANLKEIPSVRRACIGESAARCDLTMPPATGGYVGPNLCIDARTRWRDTDSEFFGLTRYYVSAINRVRSP